MDRELVRLCSCCLKIFYGSRIKIIAKEHECGTFPCTKVNGPCLKKFSSSMSNKHQCIFRRDIGAQFVIQLDPSLIPTRHSEIIDCYIPKNVSFSEKIKNRKKKTFSLIKKIFSSEDKESYLEKMSLKKDSLETQKKKYKVIVDFLFSDDPENGHKFYRILDQHHLTSPKALRISAEISGPEFVIDTIVESCHDELKEMASSAVRSLIDACAIKKQH